MHPTSYEKMAAMVSVHLEPYRGVPLEVLDFGSQMVDDQQDTYRTLIDDPAWHYRGLDIEPGRNVDVCVADPYHWAEIPPDSIDLVISGQALEHVEFFWASMFEVTRVLRPGGVTTVIAPAGGVEHRFPVDCWRFYRDGFTALSRYVGLEVVDVDTDWGNGLWEDSILVARKPVWSGAERRRFAERARLQRRLVVDVSGDPFDLPGEGSGGDAGDDEPPVPSPLAGISPGALTAELTSRREARVNTEATPPPPPHDTDRASVAEAGTADTTDGPPSAPAGAVPSWRARWVREAGPPTGG